MTRSFLPRLIVVSVLGTALGSSFLYAQTPGASGQDGAPLPTGLPFPLPSPADAASSGDPATDDAAADAATPARPALSARVAGLIAESPFLPEGFKPPGQPTNANAQNEAPPQRAVEFRGVYELSGEVFVNLFNLGTQKGEWLKVGEQRGPYHVQRFDAARNTVFVTVGGRAEEISLKKPSDQPIPVQTAPAAPIPSPGAVAGAPATPPTRPAPGAPGAGVPVPRPRRIVLPPSTPGAAGGGGGAQATAPGRPGAAPGAATTSAGNTVINVDVPDPSNPGPQPVTSGAPSGPVPVIRNDGSTGSPSGTPATITAEEMLQLLQSRGGQNPNP